jgi:hypothetical protein
MGQMQEIFEEITWIEDPEAWDAAHETGESPKWLVGTPEQDELSLYLASAMLGRQWLEAEVIEY